MKRTCPRCECSIWVIRPQMGFGMHRPILLFDHKPTLREIDAFYLAVGLVGKRTFRKITRRRKQ